MEYFSSSLLAPFFRANSQVLPVKPVFPNGEIVSVAKTNIPGKTCSEGGVGFIIAHQTVNNEQKFTVKYIPGTTAVKQETAVCMDRLSPYTLLPLARTRTPTRTTSDHTTHPSAHTSPIKPKRLFCGLSLLLPSTMSPSKRNPTNSASTFSTAQTHLNQQATRRSTRIKNKSTSTENNEQTIIESAPPLTMEALLVKPDVTVSDLQKLTFQSTANHASTHPLIQLLAHRRRTGTKKDCGWLRRSDARVRLGDDEPKLPPQLTNEERGQLLKVLQLLKGIPRTTAIRPMDDLAFAYGMHRKTLQRVKKRAMVSKNFSPNRLPHGMKGRTIFNCRRVQEIYFSPYAIFKRVKFQESTVVDAFDYKELRKEFDNLPPHRKAIYENESKITLARAPSLWSEAVNHLQQSKGTISWRQLANLLAQDGQIKYQVISLETLCRHFLSIPSFSYKTTKMIPLLTPYHVKKRMNWVNEFFQFWNNAKLVHQRAQVMLVDQDEKWFFALVARTNLKSIPMLGIIPHTHKCGNKRHIEKVMVTCTTGFIPRDNIIEKGGIGVKVSFNRIGALVEATRTSYKRKYLPDNTYTADKEKISKEKGKFYFRAQECTGSTDGGPDGTKFSLKKYYKQVEIPALEEIVWKYESENIGKKLVVRYNTDGAGPHTDSVLLKFLHEEMELKRGWIITRQPPNSPITNTNDSTIFPSLSKQLSNYQGIKHNSHRINGEMLWQAAKNVWDQLPLSVIASAYVAKSQIASAIYAHKGSDEFQRGKGAMHFGVRSHYVASEEGVDSIETYTDHPAVDEQFLQDRKLKYKVPELEQEDMPDTMLLSELKFFCKYLPDDHSLKKLLEKSRAKVEQQSSFKLSRIRHNVISRSGNKIKTKVVKKAGNQNQKAGKKGTVHQKRTNLKAPPPGSVKRVLTEKEWSVLKKKYRRRRWCGQNRKRKHPKRNHQKHLIVLLSLVKLLDRKMMIANMWLIRK